WIRHARYCGAGSYPGRGVVGEILAGRRHDSCHYFPVEKVATRTKVKNMSEPITVLIADDHPVFRRGLREVFEEDKRFQVIVEAANGAEALNLIRQFKPKVTVLDIRMPELNGLQVAREAGSHRLGTGFVNLTNPPDEELFDQAMDLGILGYVLKENAVIDVLAAVENVAHGRLFLTQSISEMLVARRTRARQLADEHSG